MKMRESQKMEVGSRLGTKGQTALIGRKILGLLNLAYGLQMKKLEE